MATNLAPVIRQRFFDANANPLAGGKLYTYQSGTTTPQATYTDSTGGTPNANPVVLNANGEGDVWLDPTLSYKFVLKDSSDATQWTVDNVIGLLTANSVSTAAIIDSAVTTAKIADDAVTAAKLRDDASTDGNRAVTTDHIRNSAVTRAKLASGASTLDAVTIQDQKASGNAGGTFSTGAWRTRTLNTLSNPMSASWVSLSANQITLTAGTYRLKARAPAYRVNYHIAKLVNITDTTDTAIGSAAYSGDASTSAVADSVIDVVFVIAGTKVFEIQHRTNTAEGLAGSGFGLDSGSNIGAATTNVFTSVEIIKVA